MKKLISILICLAMVLGMFSVSAEIMSLDEIEFMQENGYLKGRENGLELDSLVTRAEALTLLLRACDEENTALCEDAETVIDVEAVVGEFVSAEEDGIVIKTENGLIKIDTTNAVLEGTSIEDAKEGNFVSAIVSKKQTRSIPAIAQGYAVVISEITSVKYIEVSKVEKEDNVYSIISSDGEFIAVADENTVVSPFRTRNIITISDVSEGDKIFVFSDVMTMSIPAQLMANKIIVFEDVIAETAEVSSRAIDAEVLTIRDSKFKDVLGHWAEKIINYSYKKGYVDGESEETFNPEGKVKGRELAKMILSKVGKENITIENAFENAKDFGLITDDALENAVKNNAELKREEVAKLCYNLIKITNPEKVED